MGVNDPNRLRTLAPGNSRLYERYFLMVVGLACLTMLVCFAWAYATAITLGDRVTSPWVQVTWACTCGLFAIFGLAVGVLPGMTLLTQPEQFQRMVGPQVLRRRFDLRRWPRLSGLFQTWAGIGIIAIALIFHSRFGTLSDPRTPLWNDVQAVLIVVGVTLVPWMVVIVIGMLLARATR